MSELLQKTQPIPANIVHRIAVPFLMFAAMFTALFFVSTHAVLPALLSVEVAGSTRNVQEVKAYHDVLQERIEQKKQQRTALIFPMEGTDYRKLADWKHDQYSLHFLQSSISQLAKSMPATKEGSAVFIQSFRYYPIDGLLEIEGDVRNVGPRSMTVLAQFVETLQKESFVQSVQHPTFRRIESPTLGFVSPFTLTIALQ